MRPLRLRALAALLLLGATAHGALAQTPQVPQAIPQALLGQATGGAGGLPLAFPTPTQGAAGALIGTPDTSTARQGTATEAEGGPTVAGPLGDAVRRIGPATAVFGAALFARPVQPPSLTANPNYLIRPGDQISVTVWGFVEAATIAVVDPDGNIFIPQIGPIRLAGLRAGDVQRIVEAEVRRIYAANVQVYAVLLNPGQVGVFVTGFVRLPGRHLGSASDSVIDYLVRAGGVDPARGSYRGITVSRNGRVVARVDLYDFLLTGRLAPLEMQAGDTVFVPAQSAMVGADGAVRNNYLFEVSGRAMQGTELIRLAAPLPSATNAVIRGSRDSRPFSRYLTVRELANVQILDQDTVSFITDAPAPTVRVTIEGSRIGPSVLVADRDAGLCAVLDHVAVDPVLADTKSVFLLRPSIAAQQLRSIQEAADRLERQLFLAIAPTTGIAQVRATEANLVAGYLQRARRIQPEGRLVVMDRDGQCANVRLEDGDIIVVPEKVQTVLVTGEVAAPQAVVWRPNWTVQDYIRFAGGFAARGDDASLMIRRASGEIILDPDQPPRPGDELIALPKLDPKNFQLVSDLFNLVFQSASIVRTFDNLRR